jgi:hypothetical protein
MIIEQHPGFILYDRDINKQRINAIRIIDCLHQDSWLYVYDKKKRHIHNQTFFIINIEASDRCKEDEMNNQT